MTEEEFSIATNFGGALGFQVLDARRQLGARRLLLGDRGRQGFDPRDAGRRAGPITIPLQ